MTMKRKEEMKTRQIIVAIVAMLLLTTSYAHAITYDSRELKSISISDYVTELPQVSVAECAGSASLYPTPSSRYDAYPDSLVAVAITHVGRHGARYASSNKRARYLMKELEKVNPTPDGELLKNLINNVITRTAGRWGALDSIGEAEQRGIADRMYENYGNLFGNGANITAIASYVPRCVMSMDVFTHQLSTHEPSLNITSKSGPVNNELMRPFTIDSAYLAYRQQEPYNAILEGYETALLPTEPAERTLGADNGLTVRQRQKFSLTLGEFIASLGAAGVGNPAEYVGEGKLLTVDEYRRIWACGNLAQYLERTANRISAVPAEVAKDLLENLIESLDRATSAEGTDVERVTLRFGHAETLMPLLSLMQLPGCDYLTDDYGTVGLHWKNYHVVPMASNLQLVLFRGPSGKLYLRASLNEIPVSLISDGPTIMAWEEARHLLISRCRPD